MEDDSSKRGEDGKESNQSLEDYVTEHYQQQKEEGKMDATEEIDDQRTADFFARALAESRRMNCEVEKSQKKLDTLHSELGADNLAAWQREHAAEALTPAQREHMGLMEQS